jgi:hypothetical protein
VPQEALSAGLDLAHELDVQIAPIALDQEIDQLLTACGLIPSNSTTARCPLSIENSPDVLKVRRTITSYCAAFTGR